MHENEIASSRGARRKSRRIGRGNGSGHGTYSGRGLKGQNARSGGGVRPFFEGGQLPLVKRMPHKRGFTNRFRVEYTGVNVGRLEIFPEGAEITSAKLLEAGIIRKKNRPVKILGGGDCTRPFTVRVDKVTSAAQAKIEAAGGRVERE
jgi:large subunit ribosomal protein L15